jgi:hypothetical protein
MSTRSHPITSGQCELGTNTIVPQFQQRLPGLHSIALFYRQFRDLATEGAAIIGRGHRR